MKIVIVDKDGALQRETRPMLERHGHRVRVAACGGELERLLAKEAAEMVVVDVDLCGGDGCAIATRLHRLELVPGVVMLSARASVDDRVHGLRCGADHYLTKPVDRRELLAVLERVHLRLQHARGAAAATRADWLLHAAHLRIRSPLGEAAELTSRESLVLQTLAQAGGKPVARTALLSAFGRSQDEVGQRALEVKISRLRKKLRDINAGEAPLRAEWGAGYVFAERCRVIAR